MSLHMTTSLSVKAWGSKSDKPVLVTHGNMDNAGSFDRLIPLLPKTFYYICIDLPSHGKSSFFPAFFPIHTYDFIIVFKLVLDYFQRRKYALLAHSFGSIIGHIFTQLYPEYVEKIIGIDSISAYMPPNVLKDYLTNNFESIINIYQKQTNRNRPTYTEEEVIDKISKGRWGGRISAEAARLLAKRMIKPAGKLLRNIGCMV